MSFAAVAVAVLTSQYAGVAVFLWAAYVVVSAGENVSSFHPLRKFPGPKFAAMSFLPEFWWVVFKGGKYAKEIQRMHNAYGPIVRINPEELHCNDPRFIDEICASGVKKIEEPSYQSRSMGNPTRPSAFSTSEHNLSGQSQTSTPRVFSKLQVSMLEHQLHGLAQKACDKLLSQPSRGKPFDFNAAYSRFTSDAASGHGFGNSVKPGSLQQKFCSTNIGKVVYTFLNSTYIFACVPWLKTVVLKYLSTNSNTLSNPLHAGVSYRSRKMAFDCGSQMPDGNAPYISAFDSSLLPENQTAILPVGTQSTSWTLSVVTYYLQNNPEMLARLIEELRAIMKDPQSTPSWSALEQLPYLSAVILEGLRLSSDSSARTTRIVTEETLRYHGTWTSSRSRTPVKIAYVIPIGSAISMSACIMHHSEDVFPDSRQFIPERWLNEKGQRRKDLESHLLPFSGSSRQGLGMNIEYCELYLALSALVLRVYPHMKLYKTKIDDVRYVHGSPVPGLGTGPRRVMAQIC